MVRLKIMSDIHVDVNASILGIGRSDFLECLINHLVELKDSYDALVFVGDLSNDMIYSLKCLSQIDDALENSKVIRFVPGNHDVSFNRGGYGDIYISSDSMLKNYFESKYSLKEPLFLSDSTVLVGGLGWYDYSFYDIYLGERKEELGLDKDFETYCARLKYQYWYDSHKIDFSESDVSICESENSRYADLFSNLNDYDVFVLNHFVPFYRYIKIDRSNEIWNACNAFIGSDNLGNLIESNSNVKYVAFGHTHFRYGINDIGDRKEICVPLGYFGEWSCYDSLYDLYEADLNRNTLEYYIKNVLTLIEKRKIISNELSSVNVIIDVK